MGTALPNQNGKGGNAPIPGGGKPAAPKPSRLSALWSVYRVCPAPADASINGRGINDQETYSGGAFARPRSPDIRRRWVPEKIRLRSNSHRPQNAKL